MLPSGSLQCFVVDFVDYQDCKEWFAETPIWKAWLEFSGTIYSIFLIGYFVFSDCVVGVFRLDVG